MPVMIEMSTPPMNEVKIQNTTSTGMNSRKPTILGRTRKLAELMPMMSRASICSVTRMVPISEAMLLPTLPASMRQRIEFENSSRIISRVASPVE